MRKNKMMRFASAVLVLTMLSTCAISGTFAKYVTSDSASDEARVAKWGVKITANGEMFTDSYNGKEGSWASAATVLKTGTDLVAPGTSGEMVEMTLEGTPEVAVKVTYKATVTLSDWEVGDTTPAYYCPIEVTVEGTTFKGNSYESAEKFAEAIKSAIDGYSKEYAPGTDLSENEADSLDITWQWLYEDNNNDNEKDTLLGDKGDDTIKIEVKTTVTQID